MSTEAGGSGGGGGRRGDGRAEEAVEPERRRETEGGREGRFEWDEAVEDGARGREVVVATVVEGAAEVDAAARDAFSAAIRSSKREGSSDSRDGGGRKEEDGEGNKVELGGGSTARELASVGVEEEEDDEG